MAMNRFQFQERLPLGDFLTLLGTDELCEAHLVRLRRLNSVTCARVASTRAAPKRTMAVDSGSTWAAAISAPQSWARSRAHEIAVAQVVRWELSGEAAQTSDTGRPHAMRLSRVSGFTAEARDFSISR
jgi:hypothetical protein